MWRREQGGQWRREQGGQPGGLFGKSVQRKLILKEKEASL